MGQDKRDPSEVGIQGGVDGTLARDDGGIGVPNSETGRDDRLERVEQTISLYPYVPLILVGPSERFSFSSITDVIGGKSPIPGMNVRDALEALNPDMFIIELPGIQKDLGIVDIELTVPVYVPCPTGTKEKQKQ